MKDGNKANEIHFNVEAGKIHQRHNGVFPELEVFEWTDDKVIDFVNWFMKLHKLDFRYTLENQSIIDSFKNGDDYSLWHKRNCPIPPDGEE